MVAVSIRGRAVWVRPWLYVLQCPTGGAVPILLLDTDVSENDADDRAITGRLCGGDATLRLKQEIVLGIGGEMLSRADLLPDEDVRAAPAEAKAELIAAIREAGGARNRSRRSNRGFLPSA
jgi:glucan phosphorylase